MEFLEGGTKGNQTSSSGITHFNTIFQGLSLTKSSLDMLEIAEIRCGGDDITAHVPKLIKEKKSKLAIHQPGSLIKGVYRLV